MQNKFTKALMDNKNWLTISLLIIAVLFMMISLLFRRQMAETLFFIGLIIFFFALLNTWGKRSRKYYTILIGISVLLFFFLFMFGIDVLVDIQSKYQIEGHWAEDTAWSIGGIIFTGFMAGLVGIFVCKAQWR